MLTECQDAKQFDAVQLLKELYYFFLAASWVVSPLMSGIVSSVIFIIIRFFILRKVSPNLYVFDGSL